MIYKNIDAHSFAIASSAERMIFLFVWDSNKLRSNDLIFTKPTIYFFKMYETSFFTKRYDSCKYLRKWNHFHFFINIFRNKWKTHFQGNLFRLLLAIWKIPWHLKQHWMFLSKWKFYKLIYSSKLRYIHVCIRLCAPSYITNIISDVNSRS